MPARSLTDWALLMALVGLSNPLYQVGADAMLADMIPSEQRTDAYAINRIANNADAGVLVLGDLMDEAPAACDQLAYNASCTFGVAYIVLAMTPNPLVNVVTAHYHPAGFPNDIFDSDDHSLRVDKASPKVVTVPNPTSGTLGTMLNDKATLSGGFNPTGTITFKLYDPTQPSCTGTPRFTQTVTVNGNGTYTTTGGFKVDRSGTWRWTATYSGDANNNAYTSGCEEEKVYISYHPGTIGFWKNWRNHYTSTQFLLLFNYLMTNNPKVYNAPGYTRLFS